MSYTGVQTVGEQVTAQEIGVYVVVAGFVAPTAKPEQGAPATVEATSAALHFAQAA